MDSIFFWHVMNLFRSSISLSLSISCRSSVFDRRNSLAHILFCMKTDIRFKFVNFVVLCQYDFCLGGGGGAGGAAVAAVYRNNIFFFRFSSCQFTKLWQENHNESFLRVYIDGWRTKEEMNLTENVRRKRCCRKSKPPLISADSRENFMFA